MEQLMNISTTGVSVSSDALIQLRIAGGVDQGSREMIDGLLTEAAGCGTLVGPGMGWAIRAAASPSIKGERGSESELAVDNLHRWVDAIQHLEMTVRGQITSTRECSPEVEELLSQARNLQEGRARKDLLIEATLVAARRNDWDEFAWVVGTELSPELVAEAASKAVEAFLSQNNIEKAKFLSEMLIGTFDASARAVAILSKQFELGIDSITIANEAVETSKSILVLDGRLRLLGDAYTFFCSCKDERACGVIVQAMKDQVVPHVPQSPSVLSPKVSIGVVDIVTRCIKAGYESDAIKIYHELPLDTALRSAIAVVLLNESVLYNRLPLSTGSVEALFGEVTQSGIPRGDQGLFERALFRARVLKHLGRDYRDEIDIARTLAEKCSWAHSKFIGSTRAAAFKEIAEVC